VRNARSGRREDHPALLVFRSPARTSAQETGCNHVKLGGRARLWRVEAVLPQPPRPPADAAADTSGHGRFFRTVAFHSRPWLPDDGERWRAWLTDDDPANVVFYCPECAEREFGVD
jgi:hypothetical protein